MQTMKLTSDEPNAGTMRLYQAGTICFNYEDFLATEQGRAMEDEPLFSMELVESSSPPVQFPLPSHMNGATSGSRNGAIKYNVNRITNGLLEPKP
jgi:hypothetical protein